MGRGKWSCGEAAVFLRQIAIAEILQQLLLELVHHRRKNRATVGAILGAVAGAIVGAIVPRLRSTRRRLQLDGAPSSRAHFPGFECTVVPSAVVRSHGRPRVHELFRFLRCYLQGALVATGERARSGGPGRFWLVRGDGRTGERASQSAQSTSQFSFRVFSLGPPMNFRASVGGSFLCSQPCL